MIKDEIGARQFTDIEKTNTLNIDSHSDGSYSGSTSAVGDAKGLVHVEVADVGPKIYGSAVGSQGVHVSPVQVELAPVVMHNVCNLPEICKAYSKVSCIFKPYFWRNGPSIVSNEATWKMFSPKNDLSLKTFENQFCEFEARVLPDSGLLEGSRLFCTFNTS